MGSGAAMKRALEVGPGTADDGIIRPGQVWADCGEVETLDAEPGNNPTYVHDLTAPIGRELEGRFDYVLASHVLEHIDRAHTPVAMDNLVRACKPGGEIAILVPSLEWAAQEILKGNNGLAIQGMLYGGQREGNRFDVHYVGYTLAALGAMARQWQLEILKAGAAPFEITGNGRKWPAMSNFVVMKKGA